MRRGSLAPYIILFSLLSLWSCKNENQEVLIVTELGDIIIELYTEKAPVTASNFLANCTAEIYTNAVFYRMVNLHNQPNNKVKIEVIQGGLYNDSVIEQFPVIAHETTQQTGIRHQDGTISMARNEPGTASTEFFICVGDQPSLDFGGERNPDGEGFAAFGRVVSGMDVVRKIHARAGIDQFPDEQVRIIEITTDNNL